MGGQGVLVKLPRVTSSLFLHAGLAVYWITFGLVSPAAVVKLGLGAV